MSSRIDPTKWEKALADLRIIASLLKIDKPLCALDVEATGQFPQTDRIIELYQLKLLPSGETYSGHYLFNPDVPVSPEATEIHKLTNEDVRAQGLRFEDVADGIWETMADSLLVGYNLGAFDQPILFEEFKRCGRHTYDPTQLPFIDSYRIWQFMLRRTLADAYYEFVGKELTDAHRASDDVFATIEVLLGQLGRFGDKLPSDATTLGEFCLGRQDDFVDSEGKFRWRDGEAVCAFGNKHRGKTLKFIVQSDIGYITRFMLGPNATFREDLRQILRLALRGQFPIKKVCTTD